MSVLRFFSGSGLVSADVIGSVQAKPVSMISRFCSGETIGSVGGCGRERTVASLMVLLRITPVEMFITD